MSVRINLKVSKMGNLQYGNGLPIRTADEERNDPASGQAFVLGVLWDRYDPRVEMQLTKDLLALQQEFHPQKVLVYCESDEADQVLRALDIKRVSKLLDEKGQPRDPDIWRLYQVEQQDLIAPPSVALEGQPGLTFLDEIPCEKVVFYTEPVEPHLSQDHGDDGPSLPEQGRDNWFNPFDLPPPNSDYGTKDPLVNFVWGT